MNTKKKVGIVCAAIILMVIVVIVSGRKQNKRFQIFRQDFQEMPIKEYTGADIANLALVCKIWGFMKYYHPAVRAGKYDWDRELLCVMPSLISLSSTEERNKVLMKWVDEFGVRMKSGRKVSLSPDSVKLYPDLDWIEDEFALGAGLSGKLKEIRDAGRDTVSHYVRLVKWQTEYGNAVFEHEDGYSECEFPHIGYQLLSLFRLWNAIQYYFPYKYLLKKDWDETLLNNIPLFLNISNKIDYENALKRFIAETYDTHAGIYGGETKPFVAPVIVRFIEGKAVVTEYYELKPNRQGETVEQILQPGDVIIRVNSEDVDSLVESTAPYISASNGASLLRNIATRELLYSNDKMLYVDYERNGVAGKAKVGCVPWKKLKSSISQKMQPLVTTLPSNILYLYMGSSIGGKVPEEVKEKGMIIDLRAYPDGEKIEGYWDYELLYPSPTDFAMFTHGSLLHPGLFTFCPAVKVGKENKNYYQGKKVILVNEVTQSHAEFMAMKYRCSPNTIVMGSTTAGADGNVSTIKLPGNLNAVFTGLGVYYPDKSETQQIGIVPDIEVGSTIQGIRDGRDEVLEAAINYIKN